MSCVCNLAELIIILLESSGCVLYRFCFVTGLSDGIIHMETRQGSSFFFLGEQVNR